MIGHLVLVEPRPDLTAEQRQRALDALGAAVTAIPEIRRARIGRRVTHGLPGYESQMEHDYEFVLLLEFDDVAGLKRYLRAPAHEGLGLLFATASAHALAYDYDLSDAPAEPRFTPHA